MKHATTFVVRGTLQFPADMLRTDACFPATPDDVNNMMDSITGTYDKPTPVTITLVHVTDVKGWKPTSQRWESFGWDVIDVVPAVFRWQE